MQIKYISDSPGKSPGLLRKLVAVVVTVTLFALVLMFSAVLLAVIAIVGTIAWAYLWWKMRGLRKRMREFSSREVVWETKASNDDVFEGEVIRVVEPKDAK